MITTLKRSMLAALVLLFASTSWNLLAGPKADQTTTQSGGAVSSDSYMGLSGEELWSNNCLRCHNIRPPTMYSDAQWDVIVHHMRIRANITGQEQRAIVEFLKSAKWRCIAWGDKDYCRKQLHGLSRIEHDRAPKQAWVCTRLANPLPVYGLAVATLALVIALLLKTRAVRVTALALVILSAAWAWPVYYYGEAGYNRVKTMVDEAGDKWLEEHMRRGEQLIYIFYVLAALAAAAITAELAAPKAAVPMAIATLILALVSLGVGGYIAYAGGRVRHKEFGFEAPPEPNMTTPGRLDVARRLQDYNRAASEK